ncbi:MAG: substrate-binding domain-containing protein [Stigonema ocellatum SAG 48.90 = DSM 106950]|nr:substrate-binding domain-containing protein [Stigonema ocellatum SAG 48.90 = DSM 106950]
MAIVKLKLRHTSEEGFLAILTATNRGYETEGFLPPLSSELKSSFNQWQSAYRQIEDVRSCIAAEPGVRLTPKSVTIQSNQEQAEAVKTHLNQWLNSGDNGWQPIRNELIAIAQQLHQPDDEIRLILDAKDISLRRLPWQEWDLFEEYYPQMEIALSVPKGTQPGNSVHIPSSSTVRILVAVGRSDDINTEDDLRVIQRLKELGAEVVPLMQPDLKKLCDALWDEKGYHIFIFTGHSGSREDGQIGWLEVNDRESLSIEQFKDALKEAIQKGLQLAIFNSCDGLGLAHQLAHLHLPQSIVMREPVPDQVAVEFLKHFFQEFTGNKSLFASVQKARKRLEHFQSRYPGAIWLPTICIGPNVEPLTWQGLCRKSSKKPTNKKALMTGLLLGLFVAGCCVVILHAISTKLSQTSTLPQPVLVQQQDFSTVQVPAGTFSYGGSTTWEPIRSLVEPKIKQKFPQFHFINTPHATQARGSGTGIEMLLDDQLSFSLSSRPLKDMEYKTAVNRGFHLQEVPVAIDDIAIAVNPNLNIPGLTIAQLKDIYTGKITNWKELGGPDVSIIPYSRHPEVGGTVDFFNQNILQGEEFANVQFIKTTTEALREVANNPGGIYYASAPEVVGQCTVKPLPIGHTSDQLVPPYQQPFIPLRECPQRRNLLNTDAFKNGQYPITRRLFVIVKQNGQSDQKAGVAYANLLLTDEAQKLIQKAGFIPIRSF